MKMYFCLFIALNFFPVTFYFLKNKYYLLDSYIPIALILYNIL